MSMRSVGRKAMFCVLAALVFLSAPDAKADPSCHPGAWNNTCGTWPGQLQPTWEVPPYGGWGYGPRSPIACNPIDLTCQPYT